MISASAPPASGGPRPACRTAARGRHIAAALVAAGMLGTAHFALAQPQPQGPQLTPNYREADIRVVADQVQQVIGRPIIIDPRVRAQVTVLSNAPMSPDGFYKLFLSTLEVHGFVALDSGDAIQIVPDANARFGQGDDYVTQAIVLDNIGAAQLVPILRPLLPQSAHLAAHPPSNALIVADRPNNIARMMSLIRRMDQAGTQDIEVIGLENASADEVVRMLSSLNQAAQASGGTPPVQVIADTRTNSVLLSGSGAARLQYRALVAHLDTPSAQGGDTLVTYLNYADAEELATKLQAQFGGTTGRAAPAAGAEGGAAGAAAGPVSIWADAGTNALVINAPERVRQDMLAVVKQIDIPRLQVMVDAIIVEISEEKAAELGVTWLVNGDGTGFGLTNFTSTTGGILQLAQAASGDTPDPGVIRDGATFGIGKVSDTGTSWAAVLSALHGDADTNIVSTPHIVTLDNEEAEIKVGQEVPFLTGQYSSTGSGNNGNVNPFQTIQREEVGTSLKITPQINEGSGVKLTIEQETSSLSQGASRRGRPRHEHAHDHDFGVRERRRHPGPRRLDGRSVAPRRAARAGPRPNPGTRMAVPRSQDRAHQDQPHGLHPPDDPAQRRGRALSDRPEISVRTRPAARAGQRQGSTIEERAAADVTAAAAGPGRDTRPDGRTAGWRPTSVATTPRRSLRSAWSRSSAICRSRSRNATAC